MTLLIILLQYHNNSLQKSRYYWMMNLLNIFATTRMLSDRVTTFRILRQWLIVTIFATNNNSIWEVRKTKWKSSHYTHHFCNELRNWLKFMFNLNEFYWQIIFFSVEISSCIAHRISTSSFTTVIICLYIDILSINSWS